MGDTPSGRQQRRVAVLLRPFCHHGFELSPGWSRTLEASVNEGLVDRDRLIDALLDMLVADLPSARAGWYSRTLRLLAMTLDEAESRQVVLCTLMSSPVGPTVTLAVGQLTALAKAGRLDLELFVRSCEGALMGSRRMPCECWGSCVTASGPWRTPRSNPCSALRSPSRTRKCSGRRWASRATT